MKLSVSFFLLILLSCSGRDKNIYFSTNPKNCDPVMSSVMEFDFRGKLSGGLSAKNDYKTLFNAIYFKGDTAGFFFYAPEDIKESDVRVFFINKSDGKEYPADRIEVNDRVVWGFSNFGGLLECFYYDKLFQRVSQDNGKLLAEFVLSIQIDSGGRIEKLKRDGRLVILY